MKTEPSDIIRLLGQLAHEHSDPTCHAARTIAERGENILNVCYETIRLLAAEKHTYRKMATDALAMKPSPILIRDGDAERLGIKLPPAADAE